MEWTCWKIKNMIVRATACLGSKQLCKQKKGTQKYHQEPPPPLPPYSVCRKCWRETLRAQESKVRFCMQVPCSRNTHRDDKPFLSKRTANILSINSTVTKQMERAHGRKNSELVTKVTPITFKWLKALTKTTGKEMSGTRTPLRETWSCTRKDTLKTKMKIILT